MYQLAAGLLLVVLGLATVRFLTRKGKPSSGSARSDALSRPQLTQIGEWEVLRRVPGAPVVYLLEEHHKHDPSTDENVAIADWLVTNREVTLVGVEGYSGGTTYSFDQFGLSGEDGYTKETTDGQPGLDSLCSDYPRFADKLVANCRPVAGVDCGGLCEKIDQAVTNGEHPAAEVAKHPDQPNRTRHFVRTLFWQRRQKKVTGNMALNAGRLHVERIKGWLADGSLDALAGEECSYVRVRAASFPTRSTSSDSLTGQTRNGMDKV